MGMCQAVLVRVPWNGCVARYHDDSEFKELAEKYLIQPCSGLVDGAALL